MSIAEWWIFLPACIGMNFFPGPNNLIALVHGTQTSVRLSIIAGLARLPIMAVMLFLLAVGLEMLLAISEKSFAALRFLGAAYLLWMAWQALSVRIDLQDTISVNPKLLSMARAEAVVATTNPKLLLIFYAFFPQFINPLESVSGQILMMGSTFIAIEIGAIAFYAFGGRWLQSQLRESEKNQWLARFTASALAAAACLVLFP